MSLVDSATVKKRTIGSSTCLNDLTLRHSLSSDKALGRTKKETSRNKQQLKREKAQRRADYLQRIPIEGKFRQGKNGYRLNYVRAKRADTSVAWINSIFLVMNLAVLLRLFFSLCKRGGNTLQKWICCWLGSGIMGRLFHRIGYEQMNRLPLGV